MHRNEYYRKMITSIDLAPGTGPPLSFKSTNSSSSRSPRSVVQSGNNSFDAWRGTTTGRPGTWNRTTPISTVYAIYMTTPCKMPITWWPRRNGPRLSSSGTQRRESYRRTWTRGDGRMACTCLDIVAEGMRLAVGEPRNPWMHLSTLHYPTEQQQQQQRRRVRKIRIGCEWQIASTQSLSRTWILWVDLRL